MHALNHQVGFVLSKEYRHIAGKMYLKVKDLLKIAKVKYKSIEMHATR